MASTTCSTLTLGCWNATDTAAQRILADTHLNIAIYVIGFTGNGGVDEALLKRVSNTLDSTNRNPDWQTGIYVAASDSNGLHNAFKTVASEILRLAK